jgi:hypothetical protein
MTTIGTGSERRMSAGARRAIAYGLIAVTVSLALASGHAGVQIAGERRAAYVERTFDTQTWLSDEYGITASTADAESLNRGNKLATFLNDEIIVVRLATSVDGTASLIDRENEAVPSRLRAPRIDLVERIRP